MKTRFIYYKGRFAKIEGGSLQEIAESEVSAHCRANVDNTTIVFFRENNEVEPDFFRMYSTKVRIVNLQHGDPDVLRPLMDRELKGVSEEVLNWMKNA